MNPLSRWFETAEQQHKRMFPNMAYFKFTPQEDITAYELAVIFGNLYSAHFPKGIVSLSGEIPADIPQRHFKRVTDTP